MSDTVVGVVLALFSLVGFAFSDFFIQRSGRAIGLWRTRFFINASGAIIILPLIYARLGDVWQQPEHLVSLCVATIVVLVAGSLSMSGLARGKLAVIEPINGLELPLTVMLSVLFVHEQLNLVQMFTIVVIFVGVSFTVRIPPTMKRKKASFEKGVVLAGFGAVGLALLNVTTSLASRETSPLIASWFIGTAIALVSLYIIAARGQLANLKSDLAHHPRTILAACVISNLAWLSFFTAVLFLPISVAAAISEGYIAFGVLLGITLNHERLKRRQLIGVGIVIAGVLILSLVSLK
jgi:drug/metabolite transporter (DMT)-like permease